MDRLDACYFCGTALDAPLREVSISPRDRRGDPDATVRVTLCPSCEDKLERVLGGLFEHVESRRVDSEESAATAETEADSADWTSGDEPTGPTGGVDRIDVATDEAAGRQGRRRLFTDPPASDGPAEPHGAAGTTDPTDEDVEILDDEPRVRARATASRDDSLADVSVDEYNRVMRLLQNRAFPVARETFVDIAVDAYDLGEDTVEQVLDAAIEGGALADHDGQLVRPDEGSP